MIDCGHIRSELTDVACSECSGLLSALVQVLLGKALGFRNGRFQILTKIPIESAAINILSVLSHDVATKRPVEAQHLLIHLHRCLNLTATVSFF